MRNCFGDPDAMLKYPGGSGGEISEVIQDGVFDSSRGEGLLAFKERNALVDGNAGPGGERLGSVLRCSPSDNSSSNLDVGSGHKTQSVSVDNSKEVTAEDSVFIYLTAVGSVNRAAGLVEDVEELDKICEKYVLAEEETEHFVLEEEPFVRTPDTITLEDAETGAREFLEATCSRHGDDCTSFSNGEGKDCAERCGRVLPTIENSRHLVLEDRLLIKGPEMVDDGQHNTVPGISQMRDVSENLSVACVVLEVGHATEPSYEDKGFNNRRSLPLNSSGLANDCPLIKNTGQTPKQVDAFPSLLEKLKDSACSARTCVSEPVEVENIILSDEKSSESSLCKYKVLLSDNENTERHQPFNCLYDEEITSNYLRCQREVAYDHPEENSVSSKQTVVSVGCQISDIPEGIRRGLLEEVTSCFFREGPSFQQPCSSYCKGRVADDANTASTSTKCSDVKDSYGQVSDGGMVNSKSLPLIVFRRTNPKRAASLRKDHFDAKPDHLTSKRNGVRKCKRTSGTRTLFSSINVVRRKRSCFHRMERKSLWGKISSLMTFFKENDKHGVSSFDQPQSQSKILKKNQCCRASGKIQMAHCDRSLRSFKGQCAFPTLSMHTKCQTWEQLNIPNEVDSQCSIETSNNAMPDFSSPTELFIPIGHSDQEPVTETPAIGESFLQRDGIQGDKDIESSLTQDISCENVLGDCPGFSSHIGSEALAKTVADRRLLDLESSPDSDIYNPVAAVCVTAEAGTLIVQDARVNLSEVVPEATLHGMDGQTLKSSEPIVNSEFPSSLDVQQQTANKKDQKERKDGKICRSECNLSEHTVSQEKFHNLQIHNTASEPLKYVRQRRNGLKEKNLSSTVSNKKIIRKGSRRAFPCESTIIGKADPDHSEEAREEELGLQNLASTKQGVGNIQIEENRSLMSDNAKLDYLSRTGRTKVRSNKSSLTDSPRRHRVKSCGQKNFNMQNLVKSRNKKKNQKLVASQESYESLKLFPESARDLALNENELRCNEPDAKGSAYGLNGQSIPQRQAWVLCDDCHKWRCIPTALADMIDETHCGWTCKDNTDKAFADCSIPQEKTNSEINAELEISDASCDDGVPKQNPRGHVKEKLAAAQPAAWTHIKSNLYLHRNRKSQTIDETMVCYCKPPSDGSLGCGDQCLNRMLNIECVKGTCPCGDLCANQQFQKRKYARLKWIPCGKKGFGLQLLEGVPSGQFLIEYVGEVLDFSTYEARQKYYASRGQKHFYFMTLNGGEVIDACAKGNLGRFINHSCDPNCRTEKWMVNGEVCIGLFAIRDIKKGEELTFDYNYVRVFGAAAKKCVCGSSVCRGYIGGDPLKTELVVQDDSEDEYFEAVMDDKCKKKALIDMDVLLSDANGIVVKDTELPSGNKVLLKDRSPISETEDQQQFKDTLCPSKSDAISFDSVSNLHVKDAIFSSVYETQSSENCSDTFAKGQNGNIISPSLTDVQQLDLPIQASPAVTDSKSDSSVKDISASGTVSENIIREKLNRTKSSHSTHHTKKSKPSVKAILPHKAKTLQSNSLQQYEGVEKELNELLDVNGGISRRKDATRGYLKLLFVTAAEGDSVGGASQSIRDLSLILDALLKTVSRTVLMDIIDKNGLQMLHNIMKQNRSRFSRIPIIRKLLKVLEFLALKGILTPEHINKGPPCSGMESFKESMLSLTRHNDVQVQQIARSFRDRWIPRMIKRVEPSDREEQQFDPQRSHNSWSHSLKCRFNQGVRDSDAIVCVSEPMEQIISSGSLGQLVETSSHSSQVVCPSSHSSQVVCPYLPLTNGNSTLTRTRKRKSRWDQPSDCKVLAQQSLWSNQEQASETGSVKIAFSDLQLGSKPEVMNPNIERHTPEKFCNGVMGVKNFKQQNAEDEVPPGFGSLQEDHHVTFETEVPRGEVVVGFLQERYLSHLSVSYGIPVSIVQKLGCPDSVTVSEGHKCWTVAPSIPFHPFPPLPPYPRGQPNPSTLTTESHKNSTITQGSSEAQSSTLSNLDSRLTDAPAPSVSLQRPADNPGAWSRNMNNTGRMSWTSTSSCCEKRFVRPERGNNQKFRRRWGPYPQEDSGYGSRSSLRSRDAGRSSRDDRKYWPPWSTEDSNVLSKVQKDKDSIVGVGNVRDTGCGSYYQA